ncbi:hypothetical protein OIU77_024559 [Salix suchowensis]|uniref:Pentatricopeptide repeat-containing protein n=1 Tax=Salix suchowensis TaxID=1278906 RepID=A0ABQ9BT65_9ROSI|nr:hypothetical protein OIU77_024559 [Salix suchowensis]
MECSQIGLRLIRFCVCSKGGLWEAARSLSSEMVNRGIVQDIFTYNTLLDAVCKGGQLDMAFEIMFEEAMDVCREMENSGIRKDVVTYNALLGGYGKQYKYDVVRRVFEEMKARHVSPNLLTYSTLIDVYSKGGLYREAMDVFREFKKAGLKADVVLYSALIDALCKNGCICWPATTESVVDDAGRIRRTTRSIRIFGQLAAEKGRSSKRTVAGRK